MLAAGVWDFYPPVTWALLYVLDEDTGECLPLPLNPDPELCA